MTQTLAQRFANYICDEQFDSVDAKAVARTKQIIAYHIGLACRTIKAEYADALQAISIATQLSEGGGSATMIGQREKATLPDAAFANCTMMRSTGLDDVIFPAGIHAGLMTLPVGFALGERCRTSGAELITAIVVGYELLGKFGQFTWAFDPPRRPTQPFGSFGAIATAAKLLKLDEQQTMVAMSYAAHTAMGLAEGDRGPVTHWYSMVCRNAIVGAYAAQSGAWGSPYVLEGKYGFNDVFLGSVAIDPDELTASLGHDYAVMQSCEKRYPGTALNQVPIELMRTIVNDFGIRADDVVNVHFTFPNERRNFEAGHELGPYASATVASSSFAYQCAMLLLDGEQNPARYEDYASEEILAVTARMSVEFVTGKHIRYTRIELRTKDGDTHIFEGDDFHFAPDQTRIVLERDAEGILSNDKVEKLITMIDELESVADVRELTACLTP